MSRQLVESIIDKDFVLSESHFNDRLDAIMEKKLYEKKRQVAAEMDEAFGGLTKQEIEDRKKKGYVKASAVLQDPRDIKIPLRKKEEDKKRKRVSEESIDEDLVRDIKLGIRRTKTRLSYGAGTLAGKGIVGAANVIGAVGDAAKKTVTDPLPAAGAALKATGRGIKKVATSSVVKGALRGLESGLHSMEE